MTNTSPAALPRPVMATDVVAPPTSGPSVQATRVSLPDKDAVQPGFASGSSRNGTSPEYVTSSATPLTSTCGALFAIAKVQVAVVFTATGFGEALTEVRPRSALPARSTVSANVPGTAAGPASRTVKATVKSPGLSCSSGVPVNTPEAPRLNPGGKPHGDPASADHHGGDMPMLNADASGNATIDATIDTVTIGSSAGDIVGRAVVVHKDADDFKTQPTGNSGARVACGVIARA